MKGNVCMGIRDEAQEVFADADEKTAETVALFGQALDACSSWKDMGKCVLVAHKAMVRIATHDAAMSDVLTAHVERLEERVSHLAARVDELETNK